MIGITAPAKMNDVRAVGADEVIDRGADPVEILGKESVDVVIDNVAGAKFGAMLEVLRRGGRYVSSGAITAHWSNSTCACSI